MTEVQLRPDFRTMSGEAIDVLWQGAYVGVLTLLYREQERLQGSFIIDAQACQDEALVIVEQNIERYVRHVAEALGADDFEVVFVLGQVRRIVSGGDEEGEFEDEAVMYGMENGQQYEMEPSVMVGSSSACVARPDELAADRAEIVAQPKRLIGEADARIHVVLARDDGNALLYDLYSDASGSLPIGAATISTDGEQLSGYIDFRVPGTCAEREVIAKALVKQLAKEQSFDVLHLTMMFRNEIIDELLVYCESC
ncbi:hypothetical protein [Paenibacillus apiarius]|uniref:hypothetical protein n=1 Tax=Paenibacillus apiarius TaxID=46240 RepID=UPI00197E25C8|nr:hypothetical protein [Paenibacillus apiarius]MBN3522761.1 hypothetical protein [Paenibacillus apiarius]